MAASQRKKSVTEQPAWVLAASELLLDETEVSPLMERILRKRFQNFQHGGTVANTCSPSNSTKSSDLMEAIGSPIPLRRCPTAPSFHSAEKALEARSIVRHDSDVADDLKPLNDLW